ncbi:hypothetical protein [Flavobacterium sp. BFFFF1]|uniref:hypothetical protein n=1 Tax=Flavobacterium sp. BFFFF1 TaxID=2015557 RepID=UPI0025BFF0DC|nr:hypothetical protein [Flavobacterium sp. BFFFF1]
MGKNQIRIFMASLALLLLIGCKNTREKAQDFVNDYNASAPSLSNPNIQSTIAALKPDNTIVIIIVSTMPQTDENRSIIGQMLPTVMTETLSNIPSFQDLVSENVKFRIEYRANDNTKLGVADIDKSSLKAAQLKNSKNGNDIKFNAADPKVNEMLAMINKALPIVDKEAGTKITKIDILGEDLVYFVEVDQKMEGLLKSENFKTVMKDEILRNPQSKTLINSVRPYGVKRVKYRYIGANKKTVGEISVDDKDL